MSLSSLRVSAALTDALSAQALDASRPWLVYWITHSLDLLGVDLTAEEQTRYAV